jgi:Bacterial oxidoreductases, C-terminal
VSGVELQDHEFFVSIHGNRKPNANVKRVQPYYGVLDKLERELAQGRRARATRPSLRLREKVRVRGRPPSHRRAERRDITSIRR